MCKVMEVAEYIINTLDVDQLKLQKLLYYTQAVYMVRNESFEKCMFNNKIEAWMYGPVIPEVYRNYKKYSFDIIPKNKVKKNILTTEQIQTIDMVLEYYGAMTGVELISRTHQEEPWKNVYVPNKKHIIITNESIYNFYKDKLQFN